MVLKNILKQIRSILDESKNNGQREEIDYLLKLLDTDDVKFIKELNGVAMWGGLELFGKYLLMMRFYFKSL